MKCHILFSGKNKKNISKCRLLKILPRVLSVKYYVEQQIHFNGNVFGNKCCYCNEDSLYQYFRKSS